MEYLWFAYLLLRNQKLLAFFFVGFHLFQRLTGIYFHFKQKQLFTEFHGKFSQIGLLKFNKKKNYSKMWKENLKLSDFIHTAGDKLKHVSLNRNMKSFFQ